MVKILGYIKDSLELGLILKKYWENKYTIIFLLTVDIHPLYKYLSSSFGFSTSNVSIIIVTINIILLLIWIKTTRLPVVKKNEIGLLLILNSENKLVKNKLKLDLIQKLHLTLNRNPSVKIKIITLSDFRTDEFFNKMLNTSNSEKLEILKYYLNQTNSINVIYGNCLVRNHKNKACYYFDLQTASKHKFLNINVKTHFLKDMLSSMTKEYIIPKDDEIIGFKITAENIDFTAKYIIGTTCILNNDVKSAISIHHELYNNITFVEKNKKLNKKLEYIKNNLPNLIIEEAKWLASSNYFEGNLIEMKRYINIIQLFEKNNYYGSVLLSIYYFLKNRDIEKSFHELELARKNQKNYTWLLNRAFLFSYLGELDNAYKAYVRLMKKSMSMSTILESEEFIWKIYKEEPDKIQLLYALGVVNYFIKKDHKLALNYFIEFSESIKEDNNLFKYKSYVDKYITTLSK